jgi:hypothetical protein
MAYTEITSKSWGTRLVESIKSVLIGLLLFAISFPILFWNEGRAVQTAKSLDEGAGAVVPVSADKIEPGNESKLVHMTAMATTDETLSDEDFRVAEKAIKLIRTVEMYQWEEEQHSEERKKLGGGSETITTYEYEKTWSDDLIDSDQFKQGDIYRNPERMPFASQTLVAKKVTLGAFTLSPEQIEQVGASEGITIDGKYVEGAPKKLKAKADTGMFYLGQDPKAPDIGDTRVKFATVKPHTVSIVGVQVGDTFAPYQASAGDALLLVTDGTQTAAQMFTAAQEANATLTWILRAIGFGMMFIGLLMVFKPISVFGDVVPLVGTMLGAGLFLFAFALSFGLSFLTIAVAWLVYRPILGVGLLIVGLGAITGLVMLGIKRKRAKLGSAMAT